MIKTIACVTSACVVTSSPFLFDYGSNSQVLPKERKRAGLMLGKSNKGEGGLSLVNMENINQLLKGTKTTLKMEDAGIKFGKNSLSKDDILTSPCQNGNYYLMKNIGGYRYKLDDGQILNTTPRWQCPRDKAKYEHLNSVHLNWTRPTRGRITLSLIYVSDCIFTKDTSSKIRITCNPYESFGQRISGTFGEEDYEYL